MNIPFIASPQVSVRGLRTDVFNYTKNIFFVNGFAHKTRLPFLVIFHKKSQAVVSHLGFSIYSVGVASAISFLILLRTARVVGNINIPRIPITLRPT